MPLISMLDGSVEVRCFGGAPMNALPGCSRHVLLKGRTMLGAPEAADVWCDGSPGTGPGLGCLMGGGDEVAGTMPSLRCLK